MANASFVHRFVTESKHDFATFDHDPRMTVRPQKGITYFLREKRQHATSMFLRVEKMDTEVEERIGGEWGAMGFSGQRDSNINLLCGIGYVVHEYIHVVTDKLTSRRSVSTSVILMGGASHTHTRSYNFQHGTTSTNWRMWPWSKIMPMPIKIGAIDRR